MTFYGQFDPPMDCVLKDLAFSDWMGPGTFIECGALDGVKNSNCLFFEETLGWKGVNVEPVPHLFTRLQRNRPGALNLPFALSNKYGFAEIDFPTHPVHGDNFGNASLQHTSDHRTDLLNSGCTFTRYLVPRVPFGHLANFCNLQDITLFSLDVEGHEAEVLKSMFHHGSRPHVLCIELDHASNTVIYDLLQTNGHTVLGAHFGNLVAKAV